MRIPVFFILAVLATPAAAADDLARGRYLAEHVTACVDCHSRRDFSKYAGPVVPGTEGRGGAPFGADLGLPGTFYARNITPAKLGSWTDQEIRRALTAGVSRDGTPLFPIMPWPEYARLCEPDLRAVIAWTRTLRPLPGDVPPDVWKAPRPPTGAAQAPAPPARCPDPKDEVAYGRYLVTIAACGDCHSPTAKGRPVPGREFSGGVPMRLPTGGTARSANITPDPETGIGRWSRERFVERFRAYRRSTPAVAPGQPNTYMPWTEFAGMTDADLGAIYAYLRSVPPVRNQVVHFSPP